MAGDYGAPFTPETRRVTLTNALSLQMLGEGRCIKATRGVNPVHFLDGNPNVINAIGHADVDTIVRKQVTGEGVNIPAAERKNITLDEGEVLLVAQYSGPRLPEGTTELPKGARIEYWLVEKIKCD